MHGFEITTDRGRIDVDAVHAFLATAYWSSGIDRETVVRSIAHSMAFSLLAPDGSQAGFARVITDRATYAYLADVFVLEPHRGKGLGVWLVQTILDHPELQGLRRWALATGDAHGLYTRFGFGPPERPALHMFRERKR
ncbi:MAG TPA: GNAT family N-acetyltransferase [Solirubrobacteraceae bacterium]